MQDLSVYGWNSLWFCSLEGEVRLEKWAPIYGLGSGFRMVWMMHAGGKAYSYMDCFQPCALKVFPSFGAFFFFFLIVLLGKETVQWNISFTGSTLCLFVYNKWYLQLYKLWIGCDQSSDWNVFTENIWTILNTKLIQSRKLGLLLTCVQSGVDQTIFLWCHSYRMKIQEFSVRVQYISVGNKKC